MQVPFFKGKGSVFRTAVAMELKVEYCAPVSDGTPGPPLHALTDCCMQPSAGLQGCSRRSTCGAVFQTSSQYQVFEPAHNLKHAQYCTG